MAGITTDGLAGAIRQARETKKAVWLYDGGAKGAGQLIAKASASGVSFYFDYKNSDKKRDRLALGQYSEKPKEGKLTLKEARAKAGEYSRTHREITKNVRAHLDEERARINAEIEQRRIEREKAEAGSLGALISTYIEHLRKSGKQSYKATASSLRCHVLEPFPDLVAKPANTLTKSSFTPIFDRMHDNGINRGLGTVRTALHAAYNLALKAEKAGREAFRIFHVEYNPIGGIDTYKDRSIPGERVLTIKELRDYLRAINALPNPVLRLAMLLHIYLGGQRPTQLFRVTAADVDLDRNTITQYDSKGKRLHPRAHVLPLTAKTRAWVEELLTINATAPGIFSTDGKTTIWPNTASGIAHKIGGGAYRLGDIRRTVETEMGRLNIDKYIKAQLLSHGLGDVQSRHYDKFAYIDQKREALIKWEGYLDAIAAGDNVIPLTA